jgi:uncharacterized protein YkwD
MGIGPPRLRRRCIGTVSLQSWRRLGWAALAATLLAVSPGSANGAAGIELTFTENAVVYAINDTRVEHGVAPLRINDDLVRAARFHSKDMVERQYFEHGPFGERLKRFGFKTGTVGENLGWLNNHTLAAPRLIRMWLRSPSHREVLLHPRLRVVGVGIRVGPFMGWDRAVVVTVDFWSP